MTELMQWLRAEIVAAKEVGWMSRADALQEVLDKINIGAVDDVIKRYFLSDFGDNAVLYNEDGSYNAYGVQHRAIDNLIGILQIMRQMTIDVEQREATGDSEGVYDEGMQRLLSMMDDFGGGELCTLTYGDESVGRKVRMRVEMWAEETTPGAQPDQGDCPERM